MITMSNNSNLIVGLILGLIIGSGAMIMYITPTSNKYESLGNDNIKLEQENDASLAIISSLTDDLNELEDNYRSLQDTHRILSTEKSTLEYENNELTDEVGYLSENWRSLSEDVIAFRDDLISYCILNESFARVFTSAEIDKIADTVELVTRDDDNIWDGLNSIHTYVRDDIEYVWDSDVPVIGTYYYFNDIDSPLVSEFDTYYRRNMYQSLDFTVEYEQGDCDDQAMLEYAMIKYYERYILDEEYTIYLVRMDWDDAAHLTVFQPVTEGRICILDPAGEYQTGTLSNLDSKSARTELNNYHDHWFDEYGPIRSIEMYVVDIDTGDHILSLSGSFEEAIEFFE